MMTKAVTLSHYNDEEIMMQTHPRQIYFSKLFAGVVGILLSACIIPAIYADGGGSYSMYDTNRDNYLDKAEFEIFAETKRKRSIAPEIWAFEKVDTDADGKISEQEMVNVLMEELKQKKQSK